MWINVDLEPVFSAFLQYAYGIVHELVIIFPPEYGRLSNQRDMEYTGLRLTVPHALALPKSQDT